MQKPFLLPAASHAVEVTKRIDSSTSPLLLLGDNSADFQCNIAFQHLAAGREHPSPRVQLHSNSECNSNSYSNSALIEKSRHHQCVATCMRNVPSNHTNQDFARHLSAKSQDVTHTPPTRSCHPPNVTVFQHATSIPTLVICLNRPQQGDDPSDRLGGGPLRRRIVQNVQLIPERGVNFRVREDHVMAVLGWSAGRRPLVIRFGNWI